MASGSLNLAVDDSVVVALRRLSPTLEESAHEVVYPAEWAYIPKMRKAYWYYMGTATNGQIEHSVLVRRAEIPVAGVVELFSPDSLTATFDLHDGEVLTVHVPEK